MSSKALDDAQRDGVVIGLSDATGSIVDRVDIDLLLTKEPKTFNLFMIALSELQSKGLNSHEPKDKMHYFQVAGIHGLPSAAWDGVEGNNNIDPKTKKPTVGNYCTHGTILFPTWHRPYLAMLEQTIYARMIDVAKRYKNPDNPNLANEYLEAAKKFRLPYWDYFRPRGGKVTFPGVRTDDGDTSFDYDFDAPKIFKTSKVSVLQPPLGNKLTSLDNPLLIYNFPTVKTLVDEDFQTLDNAMNNWRKKNGLPTGQHYSRKHTTRQPNFPDGQEESNYDTLKKTLNMGRAGGVKRLLEIMENVKSYPNYATNSRSGKSLESLHDTYHGNIGGSGHMGMVPIAAFDPIFWLHHCNVDRYSMIWQYINSNTWFSESKQRLWPFRAQPGNADANFWDSDAARQAVNMGYNYPDISGSPSVEGLKQDFARRYRWSENDSNGIPMNCPPDMLPVDVTSAQVFKKPDSDSMINGFTKSALQSVMHLTSQTVAMVPVLKEENSPSPLVTGEARSRHAQLDQELLARHPEGTRLVREWNVNSEVARNALNGSFTLMFFLGEVNDSAANWRNEPNLAATNHIFTAPTQLCANCADQALAQETYNDSEFLTPMLQDLVDKGRLPDLSVSTIVPYLKQNLHWRVLDIGRQDIDPAIVQGLNVLVTSTVKFFQPGSYVPEYGPETPYPECTAGRTQ